MLGIVPGWGGIKRLPRLIGAPAALDLLLTGKTIDARARRSSGSPTNAFPQRIMDNTARGVLLAAAAAADAAVSAVADAHPAGAARHRRAGAQAGRAARAPRALPGAVRDPRRCVERFDGNALAPPPADPASISALLATPTARNLIRVFTLQERLKALGKEGGVEGAPRARRRRAARWAATSPRGARCAASR